MLKLSHVKKTFNKGTVTEKRALTGVDLTLNAVSYTHLLMLTGESAWLYRGGFLLFALATGLLIICCLLYTSMTKATRAM